MSSFALYRVIKKDLPDKATFQQRPDKVREWDVDVWRKAVVMAECKYLRQEHAQEREEERARSDT